MTAQPDDDPRDDPKLDQILAGGSVGGPRRDQIFREVMKRTDAERPRRAWLLGGGTALVLGIGATLFLLLPGRDPFGGKGPGGSGATAVVEIACMSSGGPVCRAGDRLTFTVSGATAGGYLGAYAEGVGGTAHQRIWYFPTEGGVSPQVEPREGTRVLGQAIQIGSDQPPGSYRVTVWISRRPLDRSEIDRAGADAVLARASLDLRVLPGS